jgi:hypothetical protein
VEAADANDPEILVVYIKHWSSKDHDDKNGKQTKFKEFPDENEATKYWQDLRKTKNFNKENQEEVDNLTSKIKDCGAHRKMLEAKIMLKPLSPEETEVKKLEDAQALEDAYKAKERCKECPVAPEESKEWLGLQWLCNPIPQMTARCQRCGGLSHLDGEKCLHDATSFSTEPAFGATEEEALWYEEDSLHAEMLRRQIVGETRCGYEFCSDSSKHRTAVCLELHSRCQVCNCWGHYATTLVKGDGRDKAVCPRFPSTEIHKLTLREIQMDFEVSATRGLLTKYRHSLPACGFYPCNTDHHAGIIRLISYAKLNCIKTEKAVAMLENMYWAFCVEAMIPDVVISDDEKFKKGDVHADWFILIMIKTCREAEESIKEARAALARLPNDANDERIEGSKTILEKHNKIIVKRREKIETTMTAYKKIHRAEYYAGKYGNKNVEGGHHLPDCSSSPTAALPRLLQFEERVSDWNDTLTTINNDTNAYLFSRAHTQHLERRSGEPIVGDKRNMDEVVNGGVEKMQRMESSSYARVSKTAKAAMDLARIVQQETTWKLP